MGLDIIGMTSVIKNKFSPSGIQVEAEWWFGLDLQPEVPRILHFANQKWILMIIKTSRWLVDLLPRAALITDGKFLFMQDNAPIHRSNSTKSWLAANEVETFSWPPLSPDLNPIENLWGWLTRKVYAHGHQFNSQNEFKTAIVKSWSEVTFELRESLISSMKNRMAKVIQPQDASIINWLI